MKKLTDIAVRTARSSDSGAIARIYNQGVEDRLATLETVPKSEAEIEAWLMSDLERYPVVVATIADRVAGWAAVRPYSHRCAHASTAELSVYVERESRGQGIGAQLLTELECRALASGLHKIVLFAFPGNAAGQRLYRKRGFRTVGVFREHGLLDGKLVDVVAMEKCLKPA